MMVFFSIQWSRGVRRIIHAVSGWISGGTTRGRNVAIVYVYSAGKDAQNSDMNPNDQVTVLRRLSTFASKEGIPVTIIFPGRPSRKIPDGTRQNEVEARYATADQLHKVVSSVLAQARKDHSPVLATNSSEIAKIASGEHFRHIKATTFEEALDSVCGPLRREQPQQPRRSQPQAQQTQASKPAPPAPGGQPEAPPPPAEPRADEPAAADQVPAPRPEPETPPRKLQRHDPSGKREIKDQAILDLIDPL